MTKAPRNLDLAEDGACVVQSALSRDNVRALREIAPKLSQPGQRIFSNDLLCDLLNGRGLIGQIAADVLGHEARPVRAILFDKTPDSNWAVPWHQDRTIAVRERRDVAGFDPWTIKAGVPHVAPPFDILASLLTLRVHLDDCSDDNAPLLIARGTHRLGRVAVSEARAIALAHHPIACHARAGDVWVYAAPILHASDRARAPMHRRVLHVDYAAMALPGGLEWLGVNASDTAS
jgi:hypothetical protein